MPNLKHHRWIIVTHYIGSFIENIDQNVTIGF